MVDGIAFNDLGEGPAVVLLHGHPFDRSLWDPQTRPLTQAGFRVIAPDLRGYGASVTTGGTVLMRELADDIVALLDRLGIATAAAIGISMGGLVAMEFALEYPERLWALGLVATTAEPVTDAERATRYEQADAAERQGMEPLVRTMKEGLYGPNCPTEVIERVDGMMRSNNPVGAAAALRGRAERPDYRPKLADVRVPCLVCAGDADFWSTPQVTQQLIDCLPSPRTLLLANVGHLPNLEASVRFNAELVAFLREARRR